MKASWVVVVANSHTAVVHRVVVGIAVGVVAPIVAVTYTVEVLAAVRIVMVVAGSMVAVAVHRMTAVAGSGHCPSVIPPGLRAVLLPRVVPSIRYNRSSLYSNDGRLNFSVRGFSAVVLLSPGGFTFLLHGRSFDLEVSPFGQSQRTCTLENPLGRKLGFSVVAATGFLQT